MIVGLLKIPQHRKITLYLHTLSIFTVDGSPRRKLNLQQLSEMTQEYKDIAFKLYSNTMIPTQLIHYETAIGKSTFCESYLYKK